MERLQALGDLTVDLALERLSDKAFDSIRNKIIACQDTGLNLEMFLYISINATGKISKELNV